MSHERTRGSRVELIEHPKTKRTAQLRLKKGHRMMFSVCLDEESPAESLYFESTDGAAVREWALKHLAKTTDRDAIDFIPVIEIVQDAPSDRGYYRDDDKPKQANFGLTVKRYWIALTKDRTEWRKLKWEQADAESSTCVEPNDRYAASEKYQRGTHSVDGKKDPHGWTFPSYVQSGYRGDISVVAYTPELYAGLVGLVKQIEAARDALADLVGKKDGIARLQQLGSGSAQLLLSAGKGA